MEKRYFIYSPKFGWFNAKDLPAFWQPSRKGATTYQERYMRNIIHIFHQFGEDAFAIPA
jgi:hypothetical protein